MLLLHINTGQVKQDSIVKESMSNTRYLEVLISNFWPQLSYVWVCFTQHDRNTYNGTSTYAFTDGKCISHSILEALNISKQSLKEELTHCLSVSWNTGMLCGHFSLPSLSGRLSRKKKKRCMLIPSQILMKHENFLSHSCRTSVDYKMAKDEAVSSFILFQCYSWILVQCILILLVQVGFNSLCISNKFIDVNAPYQWLIF